MQSPSPRQTLATTTTHRHSRRPPRYCCDTLVTPCLQVFALAQRGQRSSFLQTMNCSSMAFLPQRYSWCHQCSSCRSCWPTPTCLPSLGNCILRYSPCFALHAEDGHRDSRSPNCCSAFSSEWEYMDMEQPQFQGMLLLLLQLCPLFTLSCMLADVSMAFQVVGQYWFLQFVVVCLSFFYSQYWPQKKLQRKAINERTKWLMLAKNKLQSGWQTIWSSMKIHTKRNASFFHIHGAAESYIWTIQ